MIYRYTVDHRDTKKTAQTSTLHSTAAHSITSIIYIKRQRKERKDLLSKNILNDLTVKQCGWGPEMCRNMKKDQIRHEMQKCVILPTNLSSGKLWIFKASMTDKFSLFSWHNNQLSQKH